MKKLLILAILGSCVNAEPIKTMVEFFSFRCVHCANVNSKLDTYIAKHQVKYLDINIDDQPDTNIMYYIATDAGVGPQFKDAYFKAVAGGMTAYAAVTLDYVVNEVKTPAMEQLMHSNTEREHIKQKMAYVEKLLSQYHVQVTPTFLINQTTLLEGEDVISTLIGANQ